MKIKIKEILSYLSEELKDTAEAFCKDLWNLVEEDKPWTDHMNKVFLIAGVLEHLADSLDESEPKAGCPCRKD